MRSCSDVGQDGLAHSQLSSSSLGLRSEPCAGSSTPKLLEWSSRHCQDEIDSSLSIPVKGNATRCKDILDNWVLSVSSAFRVGLSEAPYKVSGPHTFDYTAYLKMAWPINAPSVMLSIESSWKPEQWELTDIDLKLVFQF